MKLSTASINLQIISAVVWAMVITAGSYLLNGTTGSQTVTYILLAGAGMHFFLIDSYTARNKATEQRKYCE